VLCRTIPITSGVGCPLRILADARIATASASRQTTKKQETAVPQGLFSKFHPAIYVKPFVKGQKNDYSDAEAIAEGA
jgi:hypothetical protein